MTKHVYCKAGLLLCAVSMLLSAGRTVLGQVTTGGIVGVVTDTSGSAVPDATVTITQVETSTTNRVMTDNAGNYNATALKIGRYTVSVEKQGFQQAVQSNVDVGIGQVVAVNLTLQVGSVTQKVEVTAAPPVLQTQTSALGTIETQRRIVDLPLNGRNFFKLAYLGPGATEGSTGTSAGAGATDNNRPGMSLSVNGLRVFDNNFLLDGVDNNEFGNGTVIIQPPPDAIQEFRVEENSMDAEFGRGGAMVNTVLVSGTNQLHGTAWEFLRNDKLDARNFFEADRTPFQRNQFGGQVGGPIKKDKMFIFGMIQRTTFREGVPFFSTVPTALMRTGNFSELGTPIYDPSTTDLATGGRQLINPANSMLIPAGRLNSVGQNILNLFPAPNLPGTTNNFVFNPKLKFDETSFITRFDYNLSNRDRLFVHYGLATPLSTQPSTFPNVTGGAGSGFSSNLDVRVQSAASGWTHIFSPTAINDLHGGYFRFRDGTLPIDFGKNVSESIGIPNANRGTPNTSGLTKIQISGYQQLGDSLWTPETIVENVFQLADTLSLTRGKHTVKIGADFRRQQRNFFQQTAPKGWLQFNGQYTNDPAAGGTGGNPLADVLLGIPNFSLEDNLNGIDPTRYWDLSEFVQDNIRATPNLTLNVGLRYEVSSPAGGRVGNFDLQRAVVISSEGPTGQPEVSHAGVGFDLRDWAPRVGFAWTARPKTVIRGGAGIFYAPEGNIFDDLGLNPPNLVVVSHNYPQLEIPQASQFVNAVFPTQFPTVDPLNPIGTVRTDGPVRKIPRIYEWNLTVQRQFGENWSLQAAYVGTRSTNLFDHESGNFNQPLAPLDSNFSDPTGNFGRPYFGIRPGLVTILPLDYARLSMAYHSFQVSAQRRFANGLNVLAAYTLAKSLGTADGNVNQCDIQNEHNLAAEKGPVTPDFRHRLTVSYVYELPYGRGKQYGSSLHGVTNAVLGNWQTSGVITAHTGEAFDGNLNFDATNTGAFGPGSRPDLIHNPYDFSFNTAAQAALGCSNPGHHTLDCWFNQGAFAIPALAPGQSVAHLFGNAARAILHGPNLVNFDFSLYKSFDVTERVRVQFRTEMFNLFNHPNFNLPNVGSGGGSSGVGFTNAAGGAAITQTVPDNQREIQFGLKVLF